MDFRQYARIVRAHWQLIVFSVLVCTTFAVALALSATPIYAASSQLFVSNGNPSDLSERYAGSLFTQQRVVSYARIIDNPIVAGRLIRRLKLPYSIGQLQSEVEASVPPGTVLIDVTVKDRSPQRASAIANGIGDEFDRFANNLEKPRRGPGGGVNVSVTSPAEIPTAPVAPRKSLYVVLGVFAGFLLGLIAAVVSESFDRRVRTAEDAEAAVGAPVLGHVGSASRLRREPGLVMLDVASAAAEDYRRLRTNLGALGVGRGLRSFAVSSAVIGEGTTMVVANLAIAFAQAGHRVAVVDANLRTPGVARMLGSSSAVGLTNVLAEDLPLEVALQRVTGQLPLQVLGSGPIPPNPSELLGSKRFAGVLDELLEHVELIILGTPALLTASDAAILSRMTSGVLLVTRLGSTSTAELESGAHSLRTVDARVLGLVVNRAPSPGFDVPAAAAERSAPGEPQTAAVPRA
jgi:capsular exopolysaccharide synthesis family protein